MNTRFDRNIESNGLDSYLSTPYPDTYTLSRPDSYYALLCATYKAYVVGRKGKGRGREGSQKLLGLGSR